MGSSSHHYHYDSQGNRLKKDQMSIEINEHNQILSDGQNTYTYDANGNLIHSQGANSNTTYTYDGLDRLTIITTPQKQVQFSYDGLHRRLSKTVSTETSQETCFYLYDNTDEIGSMTASGEIQELRILGRTPKAEMGGSDRHRNQRIALHSSS
jgi:YD repeat-containing protein